MPSNKPALDYQTPPPPRRVSILAVFGYTAFLVSLLNLLFYHLTADVTSRSEPDPWDPFAGIVQEIKQLAKTPHNIELHVNDPQVNRPIKTIRLTRIYFTAVYFMYPRRVFLGTNDQVINFPEHVIAADQLPSDAWMRQHHIGGICTVENIETVPHLRVIPVP